MKPVEIAPGCERFSELLPLHPFGLLEAEEARLLEEHVRECDSCRAELGTFFRTAADLPYSLPDLSPSPEIRAKLIETLNTHRRSVNATSSS